MKLTDANRLIRPVIHDYYVRFKVWPNIVLLPWKLIQELIDEMVAVTGTKAFEDPGTFLTYLGKRVMVSPDDKVHVGYLEEVHNGQEKDI
jgi:hypothetical protein